MLAGDALDELAPMLHLRFTREDEYRRIGSAVDKLRQIQAGMKECTPETFSDLVRTAELTEADIQAMADRLHDLGYIVIDRAAAAAVQEGG